MQLADDGEGFFMDLADPSGQALRVEFPGWIIHQLMRVLPHLDTAVQRGHDAAPGPLIAYPVLEWQLAISSGTPTRLALHLRNDRHVDGAYSMALDTAQALHQELGRAIGEARARSTASVN